MISKLVKLTVRFILSGLGNSTGVVVHMLEILFISEDMVIDAYGNIIADSLLGADIYLVLFIGGGLDVPIALY